MSKLHICGVFAALGLAGAALAQEPATPPSQTPTTRGAEGSPDWAEPGRSPTEGAASDVAQSDPRPSTQQGEGTAADQTQPGQTPTRSPSRDETPTDPRPSTHPAEGTAADRTSPGETSTISGRTAQTPTESEGAGEELVGAAVVTKSNAPLGEVADVVFDAQQQPAFVIIATEGESTAVPYAAASSMMSGDKVVIDQAKLQSAPRVKQGEWRNQSSTRWQKDAKEYWDRG